MHYPRFGFTAGTPASPAITDLAIARLAGEPPVVLATERPDNPGTSITNGAEALAAQILRILPDRAGKHVPFRLIVEHPIETFEVGKGEFEQIDGTHFEVSFADFSVRTLQNGVRCIGDVTNWATVEPEQLETWFPAPTAPRQSIEHGPSNGRNGAPQSIEMANRGEEAMIDDQEPKEQIARRPAMRR